MFNSTINKNAYCFDDKEQETNIFSLERNDEKNDRSEKEEQGKFLAEQIISAVKSTDSLTKNSSHGFPCTSHLDKLISTDMKSNDNNLQSKRLEAEMDKIEDKITFSANINEGNNNYTTLSSPSSSSVQSALLTPSSVLQHRFRHKAREGDEISGFDVSDRGVDNFKSKNNLEKERLCGSNINSSSSNNNGSDIVDSMMGRIDDNNKNVNLIYQQQRQRQHYRQEEGYQRVYEQDRGHQVKSKYENELSSPPGAIFRYLNPRDPCRSRRRFAKLYWKAWDRTVLSLLLFFFGLVLVIIGCLCLNVCIEPIRGLGFAIAGALMLMPGIYGGAVLVRYVLCHEGYSYKSLPGD